VVITFARGFEVYEKLDEGRYKRIHTTIRHEVVDCHSVQTTIRHQVVDCLDGQTAASGRSTPLQTDLNFLERLDRLQEARTGNGVQQIHPASTRFEFP
jgi:hypothetical protein